MPKTRLQEFAFTILMTFAMVYAMVCFNIVAGPVVRFTFGKLVAPFKAAAA